MSLVGPRPHALAHNLAYERASHSYARRHNVKPGITGWAQITAFAARPIPTRRCGQRVEYDLYYIDNWSIGSICASWCKPCSRPRPIEMPTSPPDVQARSVTGNVKSRPRTHAPMAENLGWAPGPIATIALAAAVTGIPVALHLTGTAVGIAACVALALLVATFAAPAVPVALISSYLFQNLFVSLVSPAISDMDQFNSIRAYNFILTAVIWIVVAWTFWTARASFDRRFRAFMDITTVGLISIGVYFALGLAANPSGALIYLRNIVAPYLLLQIFALVAYRHRVSTVSALVAIASFTLLYGYFEFIAHDSLMYLVNSDTYLYWRTRDEQSKWLMELHEMGRVMRSYLDALAIDFLNTPLLRDLGFSTYRISAPTSISSASPMCWHFSASSWLRSAGGGTCSLRCRCCSSSAQRGP